MQLVSLGAAGAVAVSSWIGLTLTEASASGSMDGIAAIISATAGLIASVTALVLGLRARRGASDEARVEVLLELLREQMDDKEDQR